MLALAVPLHTVDICEGDSVKNEGSGSRSVGTANRYMRRRRLYAKDFDSTQERSDLMPSCLLIVRKEPSEDFG
jgi:hypothetical protein